MIIAIIIAAVLAIGAAVYFFVIKKSSPPATVVPVSSDWVISGTHDSQPVTLKANAVHGGAVYSLVWGGTEFIDATDNGRELQTAWQENNLGEGRNPTEAGASADGTPASHSTTVVTAYNATGNILRTQAQLAYWFPYNGATLSPQKLSKTVTIGYNGLDNVIHHQITITLAEALQDINVEGLTSYSPPSFTRFFVYDLAGSIRDEDEFKNDIEDKERIFVDVVKH